MPPAAPRRLTSAAVAAFTVVITGGIIISAGIRHWALALVVLGLQVLLVVAYTLHRRSQAPMITIAVGVIAAVAADAVALYSDPFSLNRLIYVLAGAFGLTIVGQLLRRDGRARLTSSMGSTLFISGVAVSYASIIGMSRHVQDSVQAVVICMVAVGAGVTAARLCDLTLPLPRINRQVPRGAFGVVIGGMFGTAVAAYAGVVLEDMTPAKAAIGGLIVGLIGVLADLSAGYVQAGRRIAGNGVAVWPVRHGLGPLLAFGASAPVAYLLSVYYITG